MQLHSGNVLHPRRPVVLQIEDALLLASGADGLVKVDRLADALLDGKAACAQRLELADVLAVRIAVAGKRPDLLDLVLLDPHHA